MKDETGEGITKGRRTGMRTKAYIKGLAAVGAATALTLSFAMLAVSKDALAAGLSQTVLCTGTITHSGDPSSVATGPFVSIGNVVVTSAKQDCAKTTTTVTQVTDGTCNGSTPCITQMTETNDIALTTKGCGPGAKTPGITTSLITASSNPKLVGCQATSVAGLFNGTGGSYTMIITPNFGSCGAVGTGGVTACTSAAQ